MSELKAYVKPSAAGLPSDSSPAGQSSINLDETAAFRFWLNRIILSIIASRANNEGGLPTSSDLTWIREEWQRLRGRQDPHWTPARMAYVQYRLEGKEKVNLKAWMADKLIEWRQKIVERPPGGPNRVPNWQMALREWQDLSKQFGQDSYLTPEQEARGRDTLDDFVFQSWFPFCLEHHPHGPELTAKQVEERWKHLCEQRKEPFTWSVSRERFVDWALRVHREGPYHPFQAWVEEQVEHWKWGSSDSMAEQFQSEWAALLATTGRVQKWTPEHIDVIIRAVKAKESRQANVEHRSPPGRIKSPVQGVNLRLNVGLGRDPFPHQDSLNSSNYTYSSGDACGSDYTDGTEQFASEARRYGVRHHIYHKLIEPAAAKVKKGCERVADLPKSTARHVKRGLQRVQPFTRPVERRLLKPLPASEDLTATEVSKSNDQHNAGKPTGGSVAPFYRVRLTWEEMKQEVSEAADAFARNHSIETPQYEVFDALLKNLGWQEVQQSSLHDALEVHIHTLKAQWYTKTYQPVEAAQERGLALAALRLIRPQNGIEPTVSQAALAFELHHSIITPQYKAFDKKLKDLGWQQRDQPFLRASLDVYIHTLKGQWYAVTHQPKEAAEETAVARAAEERVKQQVGAE